MMWVLAMYGEVAVEGGELTAENLMGAVFAGGILYSGYLHLEEEEGTTE